MTAETLSRVLSGIHARPTFETVVRITHALGESVGTLLDEPAFFLDAEQRTELRRVLGYLAAAVSLSPAIDALSSPNAVAQRAAEVPPPFYRRGARLVFQTIGDSMIEAGIVDGDLLFVIPTCEVRDAAKHIVICRVSGIMLAKQLDLHAGRIRLLSRNERYTAIDADEDDFHLIGTVVGRLGAI